MVYTKAGILYITGVDGNVMITLMYSNNRTVQINASITFHLDNTAIIAGSKGNIKVRTPPKTYSMVIITKNNLLKYYQYAINKRKFIIFYKK